MASLADFTIDDAVAVLARTPATLDALLRGLPDAWVRCDEGNDTWSAFDIVGHLVVGERTDWMPRLRIILEDGEARPFDPFDRFAQFRESKGKSFQQLLEEFARLRKENLAALRALNLQGDDLTRRGRHPRGAHRSLEQQERQGRDLQDKRPALRAVSGQEEARATRTGEGA